MSDRQWNTTLSHAKMCSMEGKCYVFKTEACDITFSPVGEILAARIGDHTCPFHELDPQQKVIPTFMIHICNCYECVS
jgi:hypothetical protein